MGKFLDLIKSNMYENHYLWASHDTFIMPVTTRNYEPPVDHCHQARMNVAHFTLPEGFPKGCENHDMGYHCTHNVVIRGVVPLQRDPNPDIWDILPMTKSYWAID